MVTLDLLFYRKLIEKLQEEQERYVEVLKEGGAQTFEDYKYRIGYLKGISDAIAWATEVNDTLTGKTK